MHNMISLTYGHRMFLVNSPIVCGIICIPTKKAFARQYRRCFYHG